MRMSEVYAIQNDAVTEMKVQEGTLIKQEKGQTNKGECQWMNIL